MSTPANELNKALLEAIPKRWPEEIRLWRNNYVNTAAVNDDGTVRRFIKSGVEGQADLSGILGPFGRRLEIETKVGADRLNEAQRNFRRMIIRMGGIYIEARTLEDGLELLAEEVKKERCRVPGRSL
jgi:hypothetical protein